MVRGARGSYGLAMSRDAISQRAEARPVGLRQLLTDPAVRILLVAGLLSVALVALAWMAPAGERPRWEILHWSVSAVGAALAVGWSIRGSAGRVRAVRAWAAIAFVLWMLATLTWAAMNVAGSLTVPSITDILILAIVAPGAGVLLAATRGRLTQAEEAAVLLDGALGLLLVGGVVLYVFGPATLAVPGATGVAALVHPTGFLTVGVAGLIGVLAVGYPIGARGSLPLLVGSVMVGLAYLTWIGRPMSLSDPGELSSVMFTAGTLVAAYGAVTWQSERSRNERYLAVARAATRVVGPLLASLLFLLIVLPAPETIEAILHPIILTGAILAIIRQGLIVRERTAMLTTVSELTRSNRRLVEELRHDLEERIDREHETIEAERADAIETLSSNVGHEMNNPLTGVLGYAELVLAELPPDHPSRADVEKIRDGAIRARGIVTALREFARPRPPRLAPADVGAVIERVVERLRERALREDVRVSVSGDPGDPILADVEDLEAILVEVVSNAIRAAARGGSVRVASCREVDGIVIAIADDGIGMDARTLRLATEPFFTGWPETLAVRRQGLGLATSAGRIAGHGGTITLDSAPGQGTTVEIRLPIRSTGPAGGAAALGEQRR